MQGACIGFVDCEADVKKFKPEIDATLGELDAYHQYGKAADRLRKKLVFFAGMVELHGAVLDEIARLGAPAHKLREYIDDALAWGDALERLSSGRP